MAKTLSLICDLLRMLKLRRVRFDYQRVMRVLDRIAADLEELAWSSNEVTGEGVGDEQDPLRRYRRRLALATSPS